nr:RNA ligase family protein [Chondromyces crocatus]
MPWSPGATSDDVRAADLSGLEGQEIVVTEKLDGENTTLYRDGLHARSLDSAHHPSRAWMKALHGRIASLIPAGFRVSGENLYARHSIAYEALESWFYAFSVWTGEDRCLDWDATVRFARRLGVPVPPVLWRGTMNVRALRALRLDLSRQEGYVVRTIRGFSRDHFPRSVAKWVRSGHVQTDEHWMLGPVIPNGRGPSAALWDVRSGAAPEAAALRGALRLPADAEELPGARTAERGEAAVVDAAVRLDVLGRRGDARLAGVLGALLHGWPRVTLMTHLPTALGMPLARRVGDLVGLHGRLHAPFPDERRRAGLRLMVRAADLGALHAVAAAALAGQRGADVDAAREQVAWSELHAAEADLLEETPLAALCEGLRSALGDLEADAQDRCWAEAADAWAEGRLHSPEEAAAYGFRWREGQFPRLVVTVGPSGSGKSSFVEQGLSGAAVVSLDALRAARGSRADQDANAEVLREGLERLEGLLAAGRSVVWDATALTAQQRSLPLSVARRRDALTTCAVFLVPRTVLTERNAHRTHRVRDVALAAQLERFAPPYPGDAHRTWYIDASGRVADSEGTLSGPEREEP